MTRTELDLIRRALDLLRRVVSDDGEIHAIDLPAWHCPVAMLARSYLIRDPASDMTSLELWEFFAEVSTSGELEPLSKSKFLRRLPTVLETTFGVRKAHNIERDGRHQRGFRGVGIRMDTGLLTVVEA